MKLLKNHKHVVFMTFVFFLYVAADLNVPEVHTELGGLRGQSVSVKGQQTKVHAYLGIPFAKPPVGPSLRLAPPQPVEAWEGVRSATQPPPMCVQNIQDAEELTDLMGIVIEDLPGVSEDCLYLNIYTPANRSHSAKLPVMVWIHGGAFTTSSATLFDGSALAAYQDVVVVLIQYRLGLLGFLSTEDEHMPGNFGLLDQVQALRWVQQHIHNFGGDPNLVTIFGESAGGISVSLLLLSPLTEGLFHRAIAESGTAALDIFILKNHQPIIQAAAKSSGCSLETTEKFADCMRNLDINTIKAMGKNTKLTYPLDGDGHFLKKSVQELFRTHKFHTVPFITGVNDDEGGRILPNAFAPPSWKDGLDREELMNMMYMFYPSPEDQMCRDMVFNEYAGAGDDREKNRNGYTKMLGHILFTIPAIKTANAHRDAGAPVYMYEYHHILKSLQAKRPSFVRSDHGDEIFSVFGLCFTTAHIKLAEPCTEDDEQLSRAMMSYWGNFARTGSPNGEGLVHWPKYGAEEDYLSIDVKEQVTAQHLEKDHFVFLAKTVPEKCKEHKDKSEL